MENVLHIYGSSRPEVFSKKGVLRYFAKFTGKRLCQSLCFDNIIKKALSTLLKRNSCTGLFL